MPKAINNLLESVIRITEERDKKSLERVLVETLADFIEFDAIILLRIPRGGHVLEEAASMPPNACQQKLEPLTQESGELRIKHDEGLDRCINQCEIVSEVLDGTTRTLFPVEVGDKVSGILVLYGRTLIDNSIMLIRGFLRIHSNFLAILDDNEHDTLTGLLNRKTFDTRITEVISVAQAENFAAAENETERRKPNSDKSYWLGVLDIDHFKKINDNFGHIYGDEVLLLFSQLMKKTFRNADLLFRYGGEEFVVVLAPSDVLDAFNVFERFRQQVKLFDFPQVGRVTVSIGMVKIRAQEHPTTVVQHADQALYYAKENGRNQTRNYHQLVQAGLLTERRYEGDIELF